MGDLQRAINFARLEAIDRGVTTRLRPSAGGGVWTGELSVYDGTGTAANVLRVVPAMSSGATLTRPQECPHWISIIWVAWRRRRQRWSSVTCWERKAGR
jgi:hypothetical protein